MTRENLALRPDVIGIVDAGALKTAVHYRNDYARGFVAYAECQKRNHWPTMRVDGTFVYGSIVFEFLGDMLNA